MHTVTAAIIIFFAMVANAAVIYFVMRSDRKKKITQHYVILLATIFTWQATNFLHIFAPSTFHIIFLSKLIFFSGICIGATVINFVYIFSRTKTNTYIQVLLLFMCMAVSPFILGNGIVQDFSPINQLYTAGWFFPYYIYILSGLLIAGPILLYILNYRSIKRKRLQASILILALLVSTLIGGWTHIMKPFLQYIDTGLYSYPNGVTVIGPACSMILIAIVIYAILRHRLLGIKWLVRRDFLSQIFVIFISMIFAILIFFSFPFTPIIKIPFIFFFTLLLAWIIYKPIHRLAQRVIKMQVIDLYKLGTEEHRVLKKCQHPAKIGEALHSQLLKRFPTPHMTMIAYHPIAVMYRHVYPQNISSRFQIESDWVQYFDSHRSVSDTTLPHMQELNRLYECTLSIPLHDGNRLLGLILLGTKTDANDYSDDDFIFLEDFQKQATRALWNVLQLEHAALSHIDNPYAVYKVLNEDTSSR